MANLPALARVGDSVQCDVHFPTPRTITMRLETPEAAAHANGLLMDKASGWRLAPAAEKKDVNG